MSYLSWLRREEQIDTIKARIRNLDDDDTKGIEECLREVNKLQREADIDAIDAWSWIKRVTWH